MSCGLCLSVEMKDELLEGAMLPHSSPHLVGWKWGTPWGATPGLWGISGQSCWLSSVLSLPPTTLGACAALGLSPVGMVNSEKEEEDISPSQTPWASPAHAENTPSPWLELGEMRCRQEADEKDGAMGTVGGTDTGREQRCRTPVPIPKDRGLPSGLDWDVSRLGPQQGGCPGVTPSLLGTAWSW